MKPEGKAFCSPLEKSHHALTKFPWKNSLALREGLGFGCRSAGAWDLRCPSHHCQGGKPGRGDGNGTARNTGRGQKRQESAGREEKYSREKEQSISPSRGQDGARLTQGLASRRCKLPAADRLSCRSRPGPYGEQQLLMASNEVIWSARDLCNSF